MKILYVAPYYKPAFAYGGPVGSIADLLEALVALGVQTTVCTTNANRTQALPVPLAVPQDLGGVQVFYYPVDRFWGFYHAPEQNAAIRRLVPEHDLVMAGSFWSTANLVAGGVARSVGVPYIIPLHGQLNPWALRQKSLKKRLFLALVGRRLIDHAAGLYCTDPIEADAVRDLRFKSPSFVVPLGLDTRRFSNLEAETDFRSRVGVPPDAILLLFLGRLARVKRPDIAVNTLARALHSGMNVHLVCVGPDEESLQPALIAQAHQLSCAERLHFTGLLDREGVASVLASANLLLMPSEIQENFGMAALEAMAAAVPVLVSTGVPLGYWAEQAGAGRISLSDPDIFSSMALQMLSNPEHLVEMGERGRQLVQQRFEISRVAQQMFAHCQAIVATGRPLLESDGTEILPPRHPLETA